MIVEVVFLILLNKIRKIANINMLAVAFLLYPEIWRMLLVETERIYAGLVRRRNHYELTERLRRT